METITSFGDWLRRRRKALDLTQAALAQRAGCVPGTIKSIEGDARRPSKQLAERLADVLELRLEVRALFLKAARTELAADQLPPVTVSSELALGSGLPTVAATAAASHFPHPVLPTLRIQLLGDFSLVF